MRNQGADSFLDTDGQHEALLVGVSPKIAISSSVAVVVEGEGLGKT